MKTLTIIVVLLYSSTVAAQSVQQNSRANNEPSTTLESADQEMIELLLLRKDQVDGFFKVIQTQRNAFSVISDEQKRLAQYEGTIDMLKPILNKFQLAQFAAYIGCLVEENKREPHF